MYVVSVFEDGVVMDVYDPDVYLDPGVEVFPITDEEFQKIYASGNHGLWKLVDGVIMQNDIPSTLPTAPSGDIPQSVL